MVDMRPGFEDLSERHLGNAWEHVPIRSFKSRDEYLFAMQEDLAEWLDNLYSIDIQPENFVEKLETGIVLCQHANSIKKQASAWKDVQENTNGCLDQIQIPSEEVKYRSTAQPGTFVARDNISNFIYWCRNSLGVHDVLLFETDDLVMRKNIRSFILCLLEVARKGARFGMLVPMLIQLEQEIDREIASEVNGESSDAADDADVESEPEPEPVRQDPPKRAPHVVMTKQDLMSLDEMVRDLVSRCTCPNQFPMIRVAEGKYRIGNSKTKIYVRILRNHVMVRVGGGWDTLEHYLDKHDPCRCVGHRSHNLHHKTTKSAPGTDKPRTTLMERRASTSESPVRRRPSFQHLENSRPKSAIESSLSKLDDDHSFLEGTNSNKPLRKTTSSGSIQTTVGLSRSPSKRLNEIKKAQLTATLSDSAARRKVHQSTTESSCRPRPMSSSPSSSPIPIRRSRPGSFCSRSATNSPVVKRRHGSFESSSPLTINPDGRSSIVRQSSFKRSESPMTSRSSTWRRSLHSEKSSTSSTPSLTRHNSDLKMSKPKLSSTLKTRHLDITTNSTSDPAFSRSHSMREKKTTPVTATSEYLKQFRKKNQLSRSRSSDPDRKAISCPTSPEQDHNTTTSSFSNTAKLRSVSSTSRLARPESRNAIEIYCTLGRRPRSAGGNRERSESPAMKINDHLNVASPKVVRRSHPVSKLSVGRTSIRDNIKDKARIMISRGDDGRHRLDSTSSSESVDSRSERSEMDDLLQAITTRWGSENNKLGGHSEVKLRSNTKTRTSASGSTSSSARSSLDMENYNNQNQAGGSKAALVRANQRSRPLNRSKPSEKPRLTPKSRSQSREESAKRTQREETRSRSIGSPKSPRENIEVTQRSRQVGGRGIVSVRSRSAHTEPESSNGTTLCLDVPRSKFLSDYDSNHLSSSVESDSSLSRLRPCYPIPQHLKIEARLHTPPRKEVLSRDRPTRIPLPVHHQTNVTLRSRSNRNTTRGDGRCFSMPDLEDRLETALNRPKLVRAQPRPTERDYSFSSIDSVSPTQHDSGYEDGRNDAVNKSLAARGVTESHL